MMRTYWLDLGPSLLIGVGVVVATLVAERVDGSGCSALAARSLRINGMCLSGAVLAVPAVKAENSS